MWFCLPPNFLALWRHCQTKSRRITATYWSGGRADTHSVVWNEFMELSARLFFCDKSNCFSPKTAVQWRLHWSFSRAHPTWPYVTSLLSDSFPTEPRWNSNVDVCGLRWTVRSSNTGEVFTLKYLKWIWELFKNHQKIFTGPKAGLFRCHGVRTFDGPGVSPWWSVILSKVSWD